jgi:DNA-binding MarR family transcriptional regulator
MGYMLAIPKAKIPKMKNCLFMTKWIDVLTCLYCTTEHERYFEKILRRTKISSSYLMQMISNFETHGLIKGYRKKNKKIIVLTRQGRDLAEIILKMKQIISECHIYDNKR